MFLLIILFLLIIFKSKFEHTFLFPKTLIQKNDIILNINL